MIRSGNTEIILSGTCTSFYDAPIEFSIPIESTNLLISVTAKIDDTVEGFDTKLEVLSDTQANIIWINPHLLNFARTATPYSLGTIQGRRLICNLAMDSYFIDNKIDSFRLHYNFYLEDKQFSIIPEKENLISLEKVK
jgi:hypothetical protein